MKKTNMTKLIDYSKLKFRVKKYMRYDDVGDYLDSTIISYDMKNPVLNNAIMLHEFIEYTLIKSAGIPVSMIDAFDTDEDAPKEHKKEYRLYCKYHRIANNVERHFVENMGLSWKDYQKTVYNESVKIKPINSNGKRKQSKIRKVR
ncbi:MAG: hypothetical protein KGJ07_01960 [Patescibacteria group bacterium]|nr:hypothetical protein [Patescibacteria group bacterium]MDE2589033.1 hypothetical protein [Patescibacteria group bacterium]